MFMSNTVMCALYLLYLLVASTCIVVSCRILSKCGRLRHRKSRREEDDDFPIKRLVPWAIMPTRAHPEDAGLDVASASKEPIVVPARGKATIPTGLAMTAPRGTYIRAASRSGLSFKHSIEVGAGRVDRGYTAEVRVNLYNHSDVDFIVKLGDKIAQLIIAKIKLSRPKEVSELPDIKSTRGGKGFGSSGFNSLNKEIDKKE